MATPLVLLESHREHKPFADPMKPSVKKLVSPQLTQRSLDRLMTKFPSPHHLVFCRIPANFSRKECSVGSIQAMLRTPGVLEGGSAPWPWCRRAFWVWEESIMEPDHLGLCRLKWFGTQIGFLSPLPLASWSLEHPKKAHVLITGAQGTVGRLCHRITHVCAVFLIGSLNTGQDQSDAVGLNDQ